MSLLASINRLIPRPLQPLELATAHYLKHTGCIVQSGPFQGLRYVDRAFCSTLVPKIAGCYEKELHPYLSRLFARGEGVFIDLGAAEGYYAVGVARAKWCERVIAFESDDGARAALGELMKRNGISGAACEVHGLCTTETLDRLLAALPSAAILVDVEGFEALLLDPLRVRGLERCSLLVEYHDFMLPGLADEICRRLAATHTVIRIAQEARGPADLAGATAGLRALPAVLLRRMVSEHRPAHAHGWLLFEPRRAPAASR